jgi:ComEC/Rec2-related protein
MSEQTLAFHAPFRQRAPCAGLLLSAVIGIIASDAQPGCWIFWSAASLLPIALICKIRSSFLAYSSMLLLFASWHGYQVETNSGYHWSLQASSDISEHTVTLLVETEPKIDLYRSTQRFIALVTCIDNQIANFEVSAECAGEAFAYGDELIAQGKFSLPQTSMNPGEFDYRAYLRRKNIYLDFRTLRAVPAEVVAHAKGNPFIAAALSLRHRLSDSLQQGLQDDPEVAQTIQGMVLGARSETNSELKKLFEETGTIHLFAASGLQVSLFAGLAWTGIRYVRLPRRWVALAIAPIVLGYCAITGFYPATVRATVTTLLLAVGFSLERPVAMINSLCASGLLILLHDTQELFQIGFQLSFVAVLAILTAVRPLGHLLFRPFQVDPFFPHQLLRPWQRFLVKSAKRACEAISLCVICWAATLPILALHKHHISLVAIFANLAVVPLASIVMLLGVCAMVSAHLSNSIVVCINNTSWLITKIILLILRAAITVPCHSINISPANLLQNDRVTILCEASELVLHIHEQNHDWLLNTGKPSQWGRITEPYLQSQGINRIEKVVLCHASAGQTGTLERSRRSFEIDEVVSRSAGPFPIQLGAFRLLILPELSEEIVSALPNEHVDVVYWGRARSRHIPRDSLVAKVAPEVVISSGTKAEIEKNSVRGQVRPRYLYLKQDGAITAERSGSDLFIHTFCGTTLRLTARSR